MWSGSSAVVDLLKEFQDLYFFPSEFEVIKGMYGLDNLFYAVVKRGTPNFAIQDFLRYIDFLYQTPSRIFRRGFNCRELVGEHFQTAARNFISSLSSFMYDCYWSMFEFRMSSAEFILKRIISKVLYHLHIYKRYSERMYFVDVSEEEFIQLARKYIDELFAPLVSEKDKYVVIDHGVSVSNSINQMRFMRNSKLIVIDRDPRDNYADLVQTGYGTGWEFAKNRTVDKYIRLHRLTRRNQPQLKNAPDVLFLRFEDLIYHYDESVKSVADFLGLDLKNHVHKRKFFNPDVSIKNIGIWKRLLSDSEAELITSELSDYIYTRSE